MKLFLEAGQIVGTHGIKGELRVQSWCDSLDTFCSLETLYLDENGTEKISVLRARPHKNIVILLLEGIDGPQKADTMRNKSLFLYREDIKLEDGDFFVQDLIGLTVLDADSKKNYGILTNVSPTGANDVYHIKSPEGKEYLIPAIKDVIISTDIEKSEMLIRPLRGIFDED